MITIPTLFIPTSTIILIIVIFRNISPHCHWDVGWEPQGSLLPLPNFVGILSCTKPPNFSFPSFLHLQSHSLISANYDFHHQLLVSSPGAHPSLGADTAGKGRFTPEELPGNVTVTKISLSEKVKVYSKPFLRQKSETGDSTNFSWQLLGLLSDSFSKAVKQESLTAASLSLCNVLPPDWITYSANSTFSDWLSRKRGKFLDDPINLVRTWLS